MKIKSTFLLIEINKTDFTFILVENDNDKFSILHKNSDLRKNVGENMLDNFESSFEILSNNIYSIEQKFNQTFKEAIVVLDIVDSSVINFSGYKKLNGSQLERENITYVINSLKSKISEVENQKTILHIFNSKYQLDMKQSENLPIGLFGNFYSQELSFFLVDKNYLKNLNNLFSKCNLRVKKFISKGFIEGVSLLNDYSNLETFFQIKLDKDCSQVILFQNSSLKFIQNFNFGTNLVINDISKITGLEKNIVEKILQNSNLFSEDIKMQNIEKEFFEKQNFRNIKKKLILDIASARIQELAEITLLKNINVFSFLKSDTSIFLIINDELQKSNFTSIYDNFFSNQKIFKLKIVDNFQIHNNLKNIFNLVQFGWKKEAIPIVQEKKSLINRFFNLIFD